MATQIRLAANQATAFNLNVVEGYVVAALSMVASVKAAQAVNVAATQRGFKEYSEREQSGGSLWRNEQCGRQTSCHQQG